MTDLLYCESSGLLAAPILSQLQPWGFRHLKDSNEFWHVLEEESPLLVLLGDSFSSNLEEIIFSLKSTDGVNQIPLFFLAEQRPDSYLPIDHWLPRFSLSSQAFKLLVAKQLYGCRKTGLQAKRESGELTAQLKNAASCNPVRAGLEQRIFQAFLSTRLEEIPIAGTSLENVMDRLMRRVSKFIGCDFCYLEFRGVKEEARRLFCTHLWKEELRQDLLRYCQCSLPEDFPPVEADWVCSFPSRLVIPRKEVENDSLLPRLILDVPLTGSSWFQGVMMAGHLRGAAEPLDQALQDTIALKSTNTLELAVQYHTKQQETQNLYRAFSHFLPASIIEDLLLKATERDLMAGEKRNVVVLFSHIRNFDYITEHNEPESIIRFLNNYFTSMGSIIQRHGGTIDKFIGDAIFAIFGAPISYSDNCQRAVDASKEMIESYRMNDSFYLKMPSDGFHIGIGLNEGEAIIGNIGCSVKFDYTAIGDTVNLAARLESLCKHYHRDILISEVLYKQVRQDSFCRLVDIARVKGKTASSRIYSLEVKPTDFPEEWRELYQKGLTMYAMGNWYLAIRFLEQAVAILPDDFPSRQFLERCEEFIQNPPEEWDGAVTLNFK